MNYPTLAEMTPRGMLRLTSSYTVTTAGCWEWHRSRTTTGYGHFSLGREYFQAHRVMYSLMVGPVAAGMQLDHLCRNRACVNPTHLEPVTPRENIRRGASTRLDPAIVAAIRAEAAAGKGIRQIGRERGIHYSGVSRIVNRRRWADVAA